eukprot:TRINITY_DN8365_c0_g2_i1.p1 TRINITY_DN8365_c0_g2~~TRINITY_DN8365_c0_g2_i1.p1  ORF type:complete len:1447 (+),score=367.07 TRINITY_DN8365_c0_g2_i1:344-4684(+)
MWEYWTGCNAESNEERERATGLVEGPYGILLFKTEVENWLRDACEGSGCRKVEVCVRETRKRPSTESGSGQKKAKGATQHAEAQCSLCKGALHTSHPCPVTGTLHETFKTPSHIQVTFDPALLTLYCAAHADNKQLASLSGVEATLPLAPASYQCGVAPRSSIEGFPSRCLYLVETGSSRDRKILTPPCVLTLPPRPTSTVDIEVSGYGDALFPAVKAALMKVSFFYTDNSSSATRSIPLVQEAVSSMYPDTAIFSKPYNDVCLFCVCGIGSVTVPSWITHTAFVTLPSFSLYVNYTALAQQMSYGISPPPTAYHKHAPVYEYSCKSEWAAFPPSDCHLLDAMFEFRNIFHTPLAIGSGALYCVCTDGSTMTSLGTDEGLVYSIRRSSSLIVEDIRQGDLVRRRDGEVGEVTFIRGMECKVRFKGPKLWVGLATELHRVDIREIDRRLKQKCSGKEEHAVAVFGPPAGMKEAVEYIKKVSAITRRSVMVPPAACHVFADKRKDIKRASGIHLLKLHANRIVIGGTPAELAAATRIIRSIYMRYTAGLQKHHVANILKEIRLDMSKVRHHVQVHNSLTKLDENGKCFTATTSPTATLPDPHPLFFDRNAEDEHQKQASLMWANLDDYSDKIRREASKFLVFPEEAWNVAAAQAGLRKNTNIIITAEEKGIRSGDEVTIHPKSLWKYQWGAVAPDEVGRVLETDGTWCRVAFPGHQMWKGKNVDVKLRKSSNEGKVCKVEVGLQGIDDGGAIQFSRCVTKWLTGVLRGTIDDGVPTCVVIDVQTEKQKVTLQCPNTNRYSLAPLVSVTDTFDYKLHNVIMRLLHLKWRSMCDMYLNEQVVEHVSNYDVAVAVDAKVTAMLRSASVWGAELVAEVGKLRESIRIWWETPVVTPDEVTFVDTDGDVNKLKRKDGRVHFHDEEGYVPVTSINYTISTRELTLTTEAETWNMVLPCNVELLRALQMLFSANGLASALDTKDMNLEPFAVFLESHVVDVTQTWKDELTAVSFDMKNKLHAMRNKRLQASSVTMPAETLTYKERVANVSGCSVCLTEGHVEGFSDQIKRYKDALERELPTLGVPSDCTTRIPTALEEQLKENNNLLLALVGATTQTETSLHGQALHLKGPIGRLRDAMDLLKIHDASLEDPDTGNVQVIPIRCCQGTGRTEQLSCGHQVHKECLNVEDGVRCGVCTELLRVPELKRLFGGRGLLNMLSSQMNAAIAQDTRLQRCACGELIYVDGDADIEVSCAACGQREGRMMETAPPVLVEMPPNETVCHSCGVARFKKGGTCYECFSCQVCEKCKLCPEGHTVVPAVFEAPESSSVLCLMGHSLDEVTEPKQCGICRRVHQLAFSCETCLNVTCAQCLKPKEPFLAHMDDCFWEDLQLHPNKASSGTPIPPSQGTDSLSLTFLYHICGTAPARASPFRSSYSRTSTGRLGRGSFLSRAFPFL